MSQNLTKVRNKKGVTLVELLISMAILAVVIVPLLASYLTSIRSSVKSEQLLVASNIALKAMEEIKADSSRLVDTPEWTVFNSRLNDPPWTANPEIENYSIEYRVSETIHYQDIKNFNPPEQSKHEVSFNVGFDTVALNSLDYPLSSGDASIPYTLSLFKEEGAYKYSLKYLDQQTTKLFVPDSDRIDIGIAFATSESSTKSFVLEIIAGQDITLPINIYVIDDFLYKLMLSTSGSDFNIFRSLDTSRTIPDVTNKLYDIDVRIKLKDGQVLNKITSMVKK